MSRQNPPEPLEPPPREPLFPHLGRDLGYAFLVLLGLAVLGLYAVKLWRRLAPLVESPRHAPRVVYRLAVDLLVEAGLVREHGETREAFAERIQNVVPAFRQLTAWNVAARLDDPAKPPAGRAELKVDNWRLAFGAFRAQLGKNTSRRRRLLGLVNPVSFFFSR